MVLVPVRAHAPERESGDATADSGTVRAIAAALAVAFLALLGNCGWPSADLVNPPPPPTFDAPRAQKGGSRAVLRRGFLYVFEGDPRC